MSKEIDNPLNRFRNDRERNVFVISAECAVCGSRLSFTLDLGDGKRRYTPDDHPRVPTGALAVDGPTLRVIPCWTCYESRTAPLRNLAKTLADLNPDALAAALKAGDDA